MHALERLENSHISLRKRLKHHPGGQQIEQHAAPGVMDHEFSPQDRECKDSHDQREFQPVDSPEEGSQPPRVGRQFSNQAQVEARIGNEQKDAGDGHRVTVLPECHGAVTSRDRNGNEESRQACRSFAGKNRRAVDHEPAWPWSSE